MSERSELNVEPQDDQDSVAFEPTGNTRIDEAMSRLPRLDEVPIDSHPEIYDEIHTGLREALANAGRDEDPSTESA